MTRTRAFAPLAIACAAIGVAGTLAMPVANADTLPNGYSVTCTSSGSDAICNFTGCPRVKGDEAGDVLHVRTPGSEQYEISKDCNNSATYNVGNISADGITISVQGCRKHPLGSDDCGAWSDYKYVPPAAAAPAAPPPAPAPKPIRCTGTGQVIPADQSCPAAPAAAPAPPKDAIQVNENQAGQVSFDVHNTSSIDVQCSYKAQETRGVDVPATVTQSTSVPAGGTATFGPFPNPVLATYAVEISCSGTFQGQPYSFNPFQTNVSG